MEVLAIMLLLIRVAQVGDLAVAAVGQALWASLEGLARRVKALLAEAALTLPACSPQPVAVVVRVEPEPQALVGVEAAVALASSL